MITVLTGENDYAISRAVRQLVRDFDGDAERFDGSALETSQLPDICSGMTLFSSVRLILISQLAANKTAWSELEKWLEYVPDTTHLVLIEPHLDKRTKTYKLLARIGRVHDHRLLDTPALVAWLQTEARDAQVDFSDEDARYLVGYVGHDQWRLLGELQKLLLTGKSITRELIHDVVEPYPEASAFELLDCVFSGKTQRVEELLQLMSEREDPYQFLGLLSSQLLALLALTSAGERRNDMVAKDIGVHPFVLQKLTPVARRIGSSGAKQAIEKLAICDRRIKTSGVEPWDQLRRTLLTLA